MSYHITIRLGGTNTCVSAHDELDGSEPVLEPIGFKTPQIPYENATHSKKGMKATYNELRVALAENILSLCDETPPRSITIAAAGNPNDKRTVLTGAGNLTYLVGQPLVQYLRGAFGCPVILGNDLEANAYAEAYFGNTQDAKTLMYGWGTGIGGALILVINGKLFVLTSELGHQPMDFKHGLVSMPCGCGGVCVESFIGGGKMERRDGELRLLTDEQWKVRYSIFCHAVAISIVHYKPERLIVCGGVALGQWNRLKPFLAGYLQERFLKVDYPVVNLPEITFSKLGPNADEAGAVALARHFLLEDPVQV